MKKNIFAVAVIVTMVFTMAFAGIGEVFSAVEPKTPEARLNTNLPETSSPCHPWISSDGYRNVYAVWNDYSREGREEIRFNYSHDIGTTWQAHDVPLNTDPAGAEYPVFPRVSSDNNDNVYVAWLGSKREQHHVYFNHSRDGGATWQANEIMLSPADHYVASNPAITADNNGNVYVAWRNRERWGDAFDIFFNYSNDNGATWQRDAIKLNAHPVYLRGTSIYEETQVLEISADDNGNVYVAWLSQHNNEHDESDLYVNYSQNGGVNWQDTEIKLNNDSTVRGDDMDLEMYNHFYIDSANNDSVYVVWSGSLSPSSEEAVYLNFSQDRGTTWQTQDTRLSRDARVHYCNEPQINADDNGNVYAVWFGWKETAENGIRFNSSYDGGATWGNDIALERTNGSCVNPQISSDDNGNVHIAWWSWIHGIGYVYCNYSRDHGSTWQADDIQLNTIPITGNHYEPLHISSDDRGNTYVVWENSRSGSSSDIYFGSIISSPLPPPVITDISPNAGYAGDTITIAGQNFGPYTAQQYYRPEADIDNDGYSFDQDDIDLLLAAWQSQEGDVNYNLDCDITRDGKVNGDDVQWVLARLAYHRTRQTRVEFANGVGARIFPENWSETEITCVVPESAVSGEIRVITENRTTEGHSFTVLE